MQNENILRQMVKDNMDLLVVEPENYCEIHCYIKKVGPTYRLISNDENADFDLLIKRLVAIGSSEFYILCDGVEDYFEVIDIN